MRITGSIINRNYLKSLNDNLANLSKANQRIASGRKYTRLSENVSDGMRALKVRRDMASIQQQQANVRDAKGYLSSAESALQSINEVVVTAYERALRGKSGDKLSDDVRTAIAEELGNLKKEIVQFANQQYAGSFIFGGNNNIKQPFTVGGTGELFYNGVPVNSVALNKDPNIDAHYVQDGDRTRPIEVPFDTPVYIDLGMGMKMDGASVDPRTGFQISFSGMELFGCGKTDVALEDGSTYTMPNNLYNIIDQMQQMFDPQATPNFDNEKMSKMVDQLEKSRQESFLNVTDIGNRYKFLETMDTRLENDYGNLLETRSELEGVNDTAETMQIKMYEYCWLATLKMGSKILPQSLMDYIS